MEHKIDDLAKQNEHYRQEQKLRFEDQEVVNAMVTKQLSYLVENMKSILKYAAECHAHLPIAQQQWETIMSPQRHNTVSPSPAATPNTRPSTVRPRTFTQHIQTHQTTIWDFIQQRLQPAPQPPINTTNQADENLHANDHQSSQSQRDHPRRMQSLTPTPQSQSSHSTSTTCDSEDSTPDINSTPPCRLQAGDTETQEIAHPFTQQPLLQPEKKNKGWGDLHRYANPQHHFQVVSKNVSTLNPQSLDMVAIATELNSMQASIFCAIETNTAWTPMTLQTFQTQCHTVYPQHKLAVSSSQEKSEGWFQPGGTGIIMLGAWASRVIGGGKDKILGQWSYLEMVGQNDKRAILVSAY